MRRSQQGWSASRRHSFLLGRGGRCQACQGLIEVHFDKSRAFGLFEIDHIWPLQFGGRDTATNLAVLCPSCHRRKSQREAIQQRPVCAVHLVAYDDDGEDDDGGEDEKASKHGRGCLWFPPRDADVDFSRFAYVPEKKKCETGKSVKQDNKSQYGLE